MYVDHVSIIPAVYALIITAAGLSFLECKWVSTARTCSNFTDQVSEYDRVATTSKSLGENNENTHIGCRFCGLKLEMHSFIKDRGELESHPPKDLISPHLGSAQLL